MIAVIAAVKKVCVCVCVCGAPNAINFVHFCVVRDGEESHFVRSELLGTGNRWDNRRGNT